MTEENENINNKYLDIVDDSILGHGATVADNINAILRDKIGIEIDDYKKEFANDMFHGDDEEYEIEYQNAMLDVILSSKSDYVIGGSSNMFLAALCMNPEIPFDTFCKANGN